MDIYNNDKIAAIDKAPDVCPVCHHAINSDPICEYYRPDDYNCDDCLQILFRCPKLECKKLFISNYKPSDFNCSFFFLENSLPVTRKEKKFGEIIENISIDFCTIYNEAFIAEQENLFQICGVGYRKSLEFLIKDYLVSLLNPSLDSLIQDKENIKIKSLGHCISEDITNEHIKNVAKRAVWLGNDETHYTRKWDKKDLSDLKILIELTVKWLEMEALTKEAILDMPDS